MLELLDVRHWPYSQSIIFKVSVDGCGLIRFSVGVEVYGIGLASFL